MNLPSEPPPDPVLPPETPPEPPPPPPIKVPPPMPLWWRGVILAIILAVGGVAWLLRDVIGTRGQALAGIFFFFGIVAAFSTNLRAVNWRTIAWGIALQLVLALLVLKVPIVYGVFEEAGVVVKKFISFADEGAKFVFGNLHDPRPAKVLPDGRLSEETGTWSRLFRYTVVSKDGREVVVDNWAFQFAFVALPPILFVSAFFTVLYHFGILQWCVRLMARVMTYLMGTSGAETLSVSANVFMGQTEAPLIVKPYVPGMTNSELFTLMASGMAHISGGMMAVYINYGADPVAVMTTCVMACPCSLYLAKLFLPELGVPQTAGNVQTKKEKSPYANAIDAAAAGTGDGLRLALNVGAMLIVFIAFVAMFDAVLGLVDQAFHLQQYWGWNEPLSLKMVFGWLFSPVAFLMGVQAEDMHKVGTLLGSKLAINEHYAYLQMKAWKKIPLFMSDRSYTLTAFALTGFANFASIGIQIGGIGAMAPDRRHDLARLGARALFVGFTATLLNAAIAGLLL